MLVFSDKHHTLFVSDVLLWAHTACMCAARDVLTPLCLQTPDTSLFGAPDKCGKLDLGRASQHQAHVQVRSAAVKLLGKAGRTSGAVAP